MNTLECSDCCKNFSKSTQSHLSYSCNCCEQLRLLIETFKTLKNNILSKFCHCSKKPYCCKDTLETFIKEFNVEDEKMCIYKDTNYDLINFKSNFFSINNRWFCGVCYNDCKKYGPNLKKKGLNDFYDKGSLQK